MKEIDILRELFDEKIIKIIDVFLENPNKHLSLSEISEKSKVHVATTFRIVNKLVKKEYLRTILIGKSKFYQIKNNTKTRSLFKFLKKDEDFISDFIEEAKNTPEVDKVVLETQDKESAKIIVVGDNIPQDNLRKVSEEIEKKHNFKIKFVEMGKEQFRKISEMDMYELNKKIVWERP